MASVLSRKEQTRLGCPLPEEWIVEVTSLLKEVYGEELSRGSKSFFVAALTYPDELWAAFSFVSEGGGEALPVTYAASVDLEPRSESRRILRSLLDSAGVFFDAYFAGSEDFGGYDPRWIEADSEGQRFFFTVLPGRILPSPFGLRHCLARKIKYLEK